MQSIKLTKEEIEAIRNGNKTMFREPIEGITIQHDLGIAGQELGERDIYNPETGEISYAFSIGYEDEEEYQESVVRVPSKYQVGETVQVVEVVKIICSDSSEPELMEFDREKITITSIKAEALQDISEEDCIREGIVSHNNGEYFGFGEWMTPKPAYDYQIWNEKNHEAPYDWESNPYVFANGFEVVEK